MADNDKHPVYTHLEEPAQPVYVYSGVQYSIELSQAISLKRIADELGSIRATLDNLLINYANRR